MNENSYQQITQEAAKEMMDTQEVVLLDVREQHEYDSGHIPDAVLIPLPEIADRAEEELLDYDQLILVYCRSGSRSRTAAGLLETMGYTNVRDFGGVIGWPYELVTE